MDSNVKMKYIELLKKEISPALGCTEPAAVALCAAGGSLCETGKGIVSFRQFIGKGT